jgi:hypothetical protein
LSVASTIVWACFSVNILVRFPIGSAAHLVAAARALC